NITHSTDVNDAALNSQNISSTTQRPIPPLWSISSCWAPHRPNRITSVSRTAIGQLKNVLQKTAMIVINSDISQSTSRLLPRLNANGWSSPTSFSEASVRNIFNPSHPLL